MRWFWLPFVALVACFPTQPAPQETLMDLPTFEAFGKVDVPDSARDFRCQSEAGINRAAIATFVLPAQDLDAFYRSTGITTPLAAGRNPLRVERAWTAPWWRTEGAGDSKGADVIVGNLAKKIRVDPKGEDVEVFCLIFSL
jgi:hypothetical protein